MENMYIYEQGRKVPEEAKKEIKGGKLNGMTDINPMWRIKKLTELFGPCGIGWVAPIKRTWTESAADGEVIANVEIALRYKFEGAWSEEITGVGGSKLVQKEKGALVTNDEGYKMAYTDAISVACKALGLGADIYWDKDRTKYTGQNEPEVKKITEAQKAEFSSLGIRVEKTISKYGVEKLDDLTEEQAQAVIDGKKAYDAAKAGQEKNNEV